MSAVSVLNIAIYCYIMKLENKNKQEEKHMLAVLPGIEPFVLGIVLSFTTL